MTFQQLQYLAEISKCGSINKAAKKLFLSQSALSTSIMELESEFNMTMLKRTNKGVDFTSEGKEFLNYALALLDNKAHIEKIFSQRQEKESAVQLSVSTQRYPFAEAAFRRFILNHTESRYSLALKETSMHAVIDDVYDHRADIGIIFLSGMTKKMLLRFLDNRDIAFHPLITVAPCVFCRKDHPLTKLPVVHESDLNGYPFAIFEHGAGISMDFSEEYQMLNMDKPQQRIIINTRSTCTNIIAETDTISTGSGLLFDGITTDGCVSLPIADQPEMTIGWISIKNAAFTPAAKEYISALEASIAESEAYTKRARGSDPLAQ